MRWIWVFSGLYVVGSAGLWLAAPGDFNLVLVLALFALGLIGMEFATIFTNANQTFNDDTYEYDEIALPFMRDLGKAIYEIELQRERPHRPDLGRFRVARD